MSLAGNESKDMTVPLSPLYNHLLDTYQNIRQAKNITVLLRSILFTPFYHVDEFVNSHPSKNRSPMAGDLAVLMWKDAVSWTATISVPLRNGELYIVSSRHLLSAFYAPYPHVLNPFPKSNESTRNWCKVTGSPHFTVWTGVWEPRGLVKGPNGWHNQTVLSVPWLDSEKSVLLD